MRKRIAFWWKRSCGANIAEYALIIGLIALAGIGGLTALGGHVSSLLGNAAENTASSDSGPAYYDNFDGEGNLKWHRSGRWKQCDGALCGTSRWGYAVAGDKNLTDYDYSVRVKTDARHGHAIWNVTRILFRFHNRSNYYALVPKTDGVLELAKREHGRWKPWLAYGKGFGDPMQWHNYRVTVSGSSVKAYVDGKEILTYVDPHPIKSGRAGVINDNSSGRFDNVSLNPISGSSGD